MFVAYHFPPIGGGGVQRAAKFARYLPEHGVELVVLTGPGQSDDHWAPDDPSMLGEVQAARIVRVPQPPPPASSSARRRLDRLAGRRTAFARWWCEGIVETGLGAAEGVDLILGELVPYETAFGVEALARRLGVPWVADLQDPWALDEMWVYPTGLHRLADRARMRRSLRSAAAVVMNTPEAEVRLRQAFPEFREREVFSIPNGFDASDLSGDSERTNDGIFRIAHTGYLHTELGLAHRRTRRARRLLGVLPVPSVDFLTRSHVFLMQAIDEVIRADPTLDGAIELDLVGEVTQADLDAAQGRSYVRFHGYRSHAETVSFMKRANLLFLPMQDLPPDLRAGLVPGKAYEYLASGTPILAAVPAGDAHDLLLEAGSATVCRPADVPALADALRSRIRDWPGSTSARRTGSGRTRPLRAPQADGRSCRGVDRGGTASPRGLNRPLANYRISTYCLILRGRADANSSRVDQPELRVGRMTETRVRLRTWI